MTNYYVNGGDGISTGYWAVAQWQRGTSYPTNALVRQCGGLTTIAIAQDFTHGMIWFKDLSRNGFWNDSATADPASNVGGIANAVTGALFPAITNSNLTIQTANFGASAFVGTVPSGFSSVNTANGSAVTWDPANKSTNIALTNGNLTASGQSSGNASVRATASFSSGLIYWEVTSSWTQIGNFARGALPDWVVGMVNATFAITGTTGVSADNNSIGWVASVGAIWKNAVNIGTVHLLQPVASGNERVFKNNGSTFTSGATQPSWNLGAGATTADSTGTWTEVTGAAAGGWATAFARMPTAASRMVAGDNCWVADIHNESAQNATFNVGFASNNSYLNYFSVNHTVASPGSGDLLAGATVTLISWANNINNNFTMNGITFVMAGSSIVTLGSTSQSVQRYDNCTFSVILAGGLLTIGGGTKGIQNDFNNCAFNSTTVAAACFRWGGGRANIRGGSFATAASQDIFDTSGGETGMSMTMDSVDLSGVGGNITNATGGANNATTQLTLVRCKVPSLTFLQSNGGTPGFPEFYYYACDTGTDQEAHGKTLPVGIQLDDKTVVRTGGASDSIASYSERIVTNGSTTWTFPFVSLPIELWNAITGSNKTITLYGIWNGAAVPTNAEIWPEVKYLGSASSLLGSLASGGLANLLASGSNWTADTTSAWDSAATARQNTHTYAVGSVIKTASNPGRVFFCTASSGNTAASEPGGYATAVDGGSVTDGSATFRAGFRFSMAITLSAPQPQLAGLFSVTAKAARASSTYYFDPLPTVA